VEKLLLYLRETPNLQSPFGFNKLLPWTFTSKGLLLGVILMKFRWFILILLILEGGCNKESRKAAPEKEMLVSSPTVKRCLAGDDLSCELIIGGLTKKEYKDWGNSRTAFCALGARAFCDPYDRATLVGWQKSCALGSYPSCRAVVILGTLIENKDLEQDTREQEVALASKWCANSRPKSAWACADLVLSDSVPNERKLEAFGLLNTLCKSEDLASCAAVARVHYSLARIHAGTEVFDAEHRAKARVLAMEQGRKAWLKEALLQMWKMCLEKDWVACGFCGDHRRGWMLPIVTFKENPDALTILQKRQCDTSWAVAAKAFRKQLF